MLTLDDIDLNGTGRVKNAVDPTNPQDYATKAYADSAAAGAKNSKLSAVAVATTNVSLTGLPTVDGTTLTDSQRVLLVGQTAAAQNGLWQVHSGSWTRPSDYASGSSQAGAFVFIETGSVNAGAGWTITGTTSVTVDTTATTWTRFSGAGEISVTGFLTLTGNVIGTSTPSVGQGGTGSNSAAGARANLGAVGKFAQNIGDGSSTTITVNHNLNTTDVIVSVVTAGATPTAVDVVWTVTDANNISVVFGQAPASLAYRATVIG